MSPAHRSLHALFPGTFDPVTHGHLDIVRRAAKLFDRVTVAVALHPSKQELLPVPERLALLREVTADIGGVDVVQIEGLVVHGCERLGATVIVRGVRSASDVDYELQMARTNHALAPTIETVLIASSPEHAHISSTLVRQVAEMGGDLTSFVPPAIVRRLRKKPAAPAAKKSK
jgi:pantetheine-phosphate adenylyltransferase